MADGSHLNGIIPPKNIIISGVIKPLFDLLQAIACVRGYRASIRPQKTSDATRIGLAKMHNCEVKPASFYKQMLHLSLTKKRHHIMTKYRLQFEEGWKPEIVWCVTTSSGNIITRRNGTVTVMGNSKGYDTPSIKMITMARPTKSTVLFQQMIGRGTRTLTGTIDGLDSIDERLWAIAASDKSSVLVLDYVGNCGKHKLISSADIIGDYTEPVRERAKKKAEKSGVAQNMSELLKETEEEIKQEKLAKEQEEAARKQRLVAKSTYSLTGIDPFAKYKVKYQGPSQWEQRKGLAFSDKQRNIIKKIGIDPSTISISCGRQLIGEYFKQPTPGQANVLRKFGYSTDCTSKEASTIIDALAKNNWKRTD